MMENETDWRYRAERAEHVWGGLAAIVACSSPDGTAELDQVRLSYEMRNRMSRALTAVSGLTFQMFPVMSPEDAHPNLRAILTEVDDALKAETAYESEERERYCAENARLRQLLGSAYEQMQRAGIKTADLPIERHRQEASPSPAAKHIYIACSKCGQVQLFIVETIGGGNAGSDDVSAREGGSA